MEHRRYDRVGESVFYGRLENGLHIYVNTRPGFGKKYALFATDYGGMDVNFTLDGTAHKTPEGVAHFLEHKLFETEDGDATAALTSNGAEVNAFTGADITAYLFEGTEQFEENLKILLQFVAVPYFTEESVAREQGIIGQEIGMVSDRPEWNVYYALLEALYQKHPIRDTIIGTVESIAEITAETLYACHAAFYHPGNMVLCVSGDVDPEAVVRLARENLPATTRERPQHDYGEPEPEEIAAAVVEKNMDVTIPLFYVGFKAAPPAHGQEELRNRLLAGLVCEALCGNSSPLYARLYAEGLINRKFQSAYESFPGAAFLVFGGESKDPVAVRDAILAEAARLATEGIDPALWSRLKKAAYGNLMRGLNSFDQVCYELAKAHFAELDFLRFPEAYDAMDKTDAEALLRRWAVEPRCAMGVVRAKEEDQ